MVTTRVKVDVSGPMFDGRNRVMVKQTLDRVVDDVADLGVNEIRRALSGRLKHPTGFYSRHVMTDRAHRMGDRVITDSGVIYGPWIEGTSRRNQTTRFKGYRAFRRTRARLRRLGQPILRRHIDQLVARLNGGR